MTKKQSLRELALNTAMSFRTKKVFVPEWGIDVLIREPSSKTWLECQIYLNNEKEEKTQATDIEKARKGMIADIILFTDILLDENEQQVFTISDRDLLIEKYGPVHSRLLRQSMDMMMSTEEAGKKPETH